LTLIMFEYQKSNQYIATISNGLETEGAEELAELGAEKTFLNYRAVSFTANPHAMMKITVMNRLFSRILAPLARFRCLNDDDLYQGARRNIEWEKIMSPDDTFSVFANVGNSNITHSHYSALNLKDAIADYFRDKFGKRPDVDRENPDVEISVGIFKNEAIISLDIGHGPLHKRGYRLKGVEAPLKENLAAALVRISGWDGSKPLYDPFCGSGTILAEAGLQYCKMPPASLNTKWGFEQLPDFDAAEWEKVKTEIRSEIRPLSPNLIFGSDIDSRAVNITHDNLDNLPFADEIAVTLCDFKALSIENAMIICNPPYGVRLDEVDKVKVLLGEFGDFLKHKCQGSTAWILVGDKELVNFIGLKPSRRVEIYNGDIECRFVEIKIREFITPPKD
jgi:putative N6-adenine-specific DNA methylase